MESLLLLIRFLTGIFVTVRLGSKRLPQKHLLEANGRSLLSVLLGRIKSEFKDEIMKSHVLISIVTSDEVMNRDLERFREVVEEHLPVFALPLRYGALVPALFHYAVQRLPTGGPLRSVRVPVS